MVKERLSGVTAARLREIFDYDAASGYFTWKPRSDVRKEWNTRFAGKQVGYHRKDGYYVVTVDDVKYLGHRLIWLYVHGTWPEEIDHKDQNPANNRLDNLRVGTHQNNQCNRTSQANNTTGYKGVTLHRDAKWAAKIKVYGKTYHLGLYHSAEEAHSAYALAAQRMHGDFACWRS